MKVSEITISDVAAYLKLEEGEYDTNILTTILTAAKEYVAEYTGIPQFSEENAGNTLDDYTTFPIAVYVLCQDMHDNRSYYVDKSNINKVVSSILDMHRTNYL